MKKFLVFCFVALLADAFTISKSETFKKVYPAEIMKTSFELEMRSKSSDKITETFSKIIKEVKKSGICEGGKFNISPHYEWDDDKRVFKGYQGNINFSCTFKDTKKYAELLSKVKNRKGLIFYQRGINYIAPKNGKKELEDKAYKYAIDYTKHLSQIFNTTCKIKNINLQTNFFTPPFYRSFAKTLSRRAPSIESPIQKSVSVKLSVDYLFECK